VCLSIQALNDVSVLTIFFVPGTFLAKKFCCIGLAIKHHEKNLMSTCPYSFAKP
jgi:hypothetical protein